MKTLRSICSVPRPPWEEEFGRKDEQKTYPGSSDEFDQECQQASKR